MRAADFFHALVILQLLFACGLWTLLRPSVRACIVLIIVSGAWVLWNSPIEGAGLVSITPTHGVTESDLLSVIGVIIAVVTLIRLRSR